MTRPQVYGLLLFVVTVLVTVTADADGRLIHLPHHEARQVVPDVTQGFAFNGGPASRLKYQ